MTTKAKKIPNVAPPVNPPGTKIPPQYADLAIDFEDLSEERQEEIIAEQIALDFDFEDLSEERQEEIIAEQNEEP
jgi:hypothetical protein